MTRQSAITIACFTFLSFSSRAGTYQESGGLVIMEMENTESPLGLWVRVNPGDANYVSGATGSGHVEFTGNTINGGAASSPLTYTFTISQGGYYHLNLRARKRLDGDDENVFPHLLRGTVAGYESVADNQRWGHATQGVHHDRFDVSKMNQWKRIFAYGDKNGMYLHFKTMETENELKMDGGNDIWFGSSETARTPVLTVTAGQGTALDAVPLMNLARITGQAVMSWWPTDAVAEIASTLHPPDWQPVPGSTSPFQIPLGEDGAYYRIRR